MITFVFILLASQAARCPCCCHIFASTHLCTAVVFLLQTVGVHAWQGDSFQAEIMRQLKEKQDRAKRKRDMLSKCRCGPAHQVSRLDLSKSNTFPNSLAYLLLRGSAVNQSGSRIAYRKTARAENVATWLCNAGPLCCAGGRTRRRMQRGPRMPHKTRRAQP